jgi:hypothetical protein
MIKLVLEFSVKTPRWEAAIVRRGGGGLTWLVSDVCLVSLLILPSLFQSLSACFSLRFADPGFNELRGGDESGEDS